MLLSSLVSIMILYDGAEEILEMAAILVARHYYRIYHVVGGRTVELSHLNRTKRRGRPTLLTEEH